MITTQQIAIIANDISINSSGESRWAKTELARKLFPKDFDAIQDAIYNHPINLRWDEYRKASPKERESFLLLEY